MPAPFIHQILSNLSPEARVVRSIDNHYHLEMVSENSRQLVKHQIQSFRLQQEAAIANIQGMGEIARRQDEAVIANIRGMKEIAHRQDEANNLLSVLVGGVEQLNDNMENFNATAIEALDVAYIQTELLQEGFENIAALMMEQQQVLQGISDILRRPYETKVLELLKEADDALKNGMKASSRDQEEEFKDAARLLHDVLDSPIGSRNYVAWFQTGWLNWKFKGNLTEAEEAFYQAARLSAPKANLYHVYSLRHLAYLHYLQGRSAEAYDNIHKALGVTPNDHDTMYDAARYAAKTGRESEAQQLLGRCIDLQPQTIITMFSEEDFISSANMQQALASLLIRRTDEGRSKARQSIEAWQKVIEAVQQAERMAEHTIKLPVEQIQDVQKAATQVNTANYVLTVDLAKKATANRSTVIETAVNDLQQHINECSKEEMSLWKDLQAAGTMVKKDRQAADTQRTVTINQAKNIRDFTAKNEMPEEVRKHVTLKELENDGPPIDSTIGSIIGIITIVCGAYLVVQFMSDINVVRSGLMILIAMIVFSNLHPLKLISNLNWLLHLRAATAKYQSVVRAADAAFQQATNAADAAFQQATNAAVQNFRERQSILENDIKLIEVRRKKAEDALQWLKAQF